MYRKNSKQIFKYENNNNKKLSKINNAYLYAICSKKILCHALSENFKEEPDVLQKLADNKLVSLIRPQRILQILRQFFMNSLLLLRTRYSLGHENILKTTTKPNTFE